MDSSGQSPSSGTSWSTPKQEDDGGKYRPVSVMSPLPTSTGLRILLQGLFALCSRFQMVHVCSSQVSPRTFTQDASRRTRRLRRVSEVRDVRFEVMYHEGVSEMSVKSFEEGSGLEQDHYRTILGVVRCKRLVNGPTRRFMLFGVFACVTELQLDSSVSTSMKRVEGVTSLELETLGGGEEGGRGGVVKNAGTIFNESRQLDSETCRILHVVDHVTFFWDSESMQDDDCTGRWTLLSS